MVRELVAPCSVVGTLDRNVARIRYDYFCPSDLQLDCCIRCDAAMWPKSGGSKLDYIQCICCCSLIPLRRIDS